MKKILTLGLCLCMVSFATAQSKHVERFRKDHKPTTSLFFYKSTLKMYARMQQSLQGQFDAEEFSEMPQLAEMIDGIEKIKFFLYEDWTSQQDRQLFEKLTEDVRSEGYEELMSGRVEGNQMSVFMKEGRSRPQGFVVIVRMETGYSIIDIEGYPNVNKIMKLSNLINNSSNSLNLSEAIK
ncbi:MULTISPECIES: DUF4252 domain-containing protein [Roseivirga]|uniref:DUF4252 domain-containing protein n=1 Tax=Roseivirga TaxID=290180 RepID=UPI00257F9CDE|nr:MULTISPECIES: DUF4252 domain-containing protein [Roseivirga]MEC7756094.1 DUF4252 domain-containing protein [Bacteroidota bacterium]